MTNTTRDQFENHAADAAPGDAQLLQLRDAPTTQELASVMTRCAGNDAVPATSARCAALDVLARCMADGALGG